MKQLHPITPESCSPYIGKTVCAVLHDGTQVVGTISRVSADGIEINGTRSGASVMSTRAPQAKKQLQRMAAQANTKAFGFGGPGYGYPGYPGYGYGYGLGWAAIALLFLLPFLFY